MLTHQIRSHFLDFFQKNGHTRTLSAPLIPHNDPTLLFVNAGMVPFKNIFTGLEPAPYPRATSAQKCLRAGGKHNDLDNVGYTSRHHTFFEMLGNFSFGDYFKEDAIAYAWTFITRHLGLPKHKLCVTVFSEDKEAAVLWKKIAGLPDHKIIPIETSDNFWSMGDVGPCGPCTEIFYDHGASIPGGPPGSPEQDGDRFVEIWNLVFMQFEQLPSGQKIPLPRPSIDTGMGLERLAAVMQGVTDNYDTDIFKALINQAIDVTGVPMKPTNRPSYKILADHVRAGAFLIADGVLPSNEGRGYVLRRILRRAMRHAYFLGARDPLLAQLVPTLIHHMGQAYPELGRAEGFITTTIDLEERRFQQTIDKGLSLLTHETNHLPPGANLSGAVAFKLYDTFGFPLDLTQDILKERGLHVDVAGFNQMMEAQKVLARASWTGSGEQTADTLFAGLKERFGETAFLGYTTESASGCVQALIVEGQDVDALHAGQKGLLIVNQTPFYGESGGQIGDTGHLMTPSGARGTITDTQKKEGLVLHTVSLEKGTLASGQEVTLSIDHNRRAALKRHHSVTHLLHQALRDILGTHVTQRGSLVTPQKLRFDFSHIARLTPEQLNAIENQVNAGIRENVPVQTQHMTPEDAMGGGALALFGEKYGDDVRVVSMTQEGTEILSKELCGGTHVTRTGDIGFFKILHESGVASGIRRIEAVAGEAAESYVSETIQLLRDVCDQLKTTPPQLQHKINRLMADLRTKTSPPQGPNAQPLTQNQWQEINKELLFLFHETTGLSAQSMKSQIDQFKEHLVKNGRSGVIALGQRDDDRALFLIGVVGDTLNAHTLLREVLAPWGGKGGGRADLAQGGWTQGPSLEIAADNLKNHLTLLQNATD